MNLNSLNILVVDDKREAGQQIVDALWDGGFSVQFSQYDPQRLMKISKKKDAGMRGVRIVFMDINLIGGAMGSDGQNFSAIQTTLQTLLAKDNGPYVLITWSTHDDYADRLFSFLYERLPVEYQPVLTKRMSKTDYAGRSSRKLPGAVNKILSDLGVAGSLIGWESLIRQAGVSTLDTVLRLADGLPTDASHDNREKKLGAVIRSFSEAEAADHLDEETAFPALSSVLVQVLHDEVTSIIPHQSVAHGQKIVGMGKANAPDWGAKIHKALHVEYGKGKKIHAPGEVFAFPSYGKAKRAGLPKIKLEDFLAPQFLSEKWNKLSSADKQKVVDDSKLILLEITPPCDHATIKKLVWHRYVLGVQVGAEAAKYLTKADYLMRLPSFVAPEGSLCTVILNSRATVSVPPNVANELGTRLFRFRAQLLSDVIRWVSSQQARLGFVSVK